MKKRAYNLAEMMIVMAIISFIIILMFTTIKPSKKTLPLAYYRVFSSLEQAVYNIYEKSKENETPFPGDEKKISPYDAAKKLCTALATDPNNSDKKGYINTVVYNCGKNFKTVDKSGKDYFFTDENMAFQSANSMKFYISPPQKIKVNNAISRNQQVVIKYFIVWVDLNGKRPPNTADYANKGDADIVPFIVTTNGYVLPAGYPTVDINYLSAYVEYPLSSQTRLSELKTYCDAQTAAYGELEYPIFDEYSIKNSLQKSLKGTAAEIKEYVPKNVTYDDYCKPEKSNDEPKCKLLINERL